MILHLTPKAVQILSKLFLILIVLLVFSLIALWINNLYKRNNYLDRSNPNIRTDRNTITPRNLTLKDCENKTGDVSYGDLEVDAKEDCYEKLAEERLDVNICNHIRDRFSICVRQVAIKLKQPNLCLKVPLLGPEVRLNERDQCYLSYVSEVPDDTVCKNVRDEKSHCYEILRNLQAEKEGDVSYCLMDLIESRAYECILKHSKDMKVCQETVKKLYNGHEINISIGMRINDAILGCGQQ